MRKLKGVAKALEDFATGSAVQAADDMASAFEVAGTRIARSLEQAARSGELSFNHMAERITQDLARLAIEELLIAPLQDWMRNIGSSQPGLPGGAGAAGQFIVNMTMNGSADHQTLSRSSGQIAAALARMARQGQGYL